MSQPALADGRAKCRGGLHQRGVEPLAGNLYASWLFCATYSRTNGERQA